MLAAFLISFLEWFKFGARLARSVSYAGTLAILPRILIFLGIWLILGLLNTLHWLGFTLDELLFYSYRKIAITKPIFVLGVPRSGTTWLQRVLAKDQELCSLQTWECIFAPSISERYFYSGLGKISHPLSWLVGRIPYKPWAKFDAIHKIGLKEPEEDFLLLLPLQACFLLVLLCPNSRDFWSLAYFDEQIKAGRKKTITHFYRRCLQKHLYFHGATKQILSKNPSFTPMLNSLKNEFKDAHFVACVRKPSEAVPSQLSALLPLSQSLGLRSLQPGFITNITDMLAHFYRKIAENRESLGLTIVDVSDLCDDLENTVTQIYRQHGRTLSQEFRNNLHSLVQKGRKYSSQHRYQLDDFGLTQSQIDDQFGTLWPIVSETVK